MQVLGRNINRFSLGRRGWGILLVIPFLSLKSRQVRFYHPSILLYLRNKNFHTTLAQYIRSPAVGSVIDGLVTIDKPPSTISIQRLYLKY